MPLFSSQSTMKPLSLYDYEENGSGTYGYGSLRGVVEGKTRSRTSVASAKTKKLSHTCDKQRLRIAYLDILTKAPEPCFSIYGAITCALKKIG